MARRFGSAMISNTDAIFLVYSKRYIRVKTYTGRPHAQRFQPANGGCRPFARGIFGHDVPRRSSARSPGQARRPQTPSNLEAIGRGNHDVKNDQIACADRSLLRRFFAAGGHIHGISLFAQAFGHKIGDSRIIFYEENPHDMRALNHSTSAMPEKTANTEMDALDKGSKSWVLASEILVWSRTGFNQNW